MSKMMVLVAFYSRTGTTKKVAEDIAEALKCDVEEIFDTKKRAGIFGYLRCGVDAAFKRLTVLKEIQKDPASYDLIIIGTPIWASNISTPTRTYITEYKERFNKVVFFCTCGSGKADKAFKDMENLCGKKPLGVLELKNEEVLKREHLPKVEKFVEDIRA